MRKLFVTIIVICLFSGNAHAQHVSPESAAAVGNCFLTQYTHIRTQKSGAALQLAYTAMQPSLQKSGEDLPCFYAFNRKEGGFVIVSASQNIVPIPAYSDKGTFDTSDLPINMKALLAAMQEEISDAIRREIPAAPSVMDKWQMLASGGATIMANENATTVAPLTENMDWDQWPYFNDSCPKDAGVGSSYGGRCPAGCTATAMAIILRHWKYPTHGYGSHGYTHSKYGYLYADFEHTIYKYENMPMYFGAFPKAYQRAAVAQLLYHCGVSVNMTYSATGSGAYVYADWNNSNDALRAFQNYFGYSHATGVKKNDYNDTQWKNLLKAQLRNSQPMVFSGYGYTGGAGHAFVCDGFDANDMFHFNWGWSGKYNCYCTIDSLCPGGVGTGGGSGNYSRDQRAVINLNPYLEEKSKGWITSDEFNSASLGNSLHLMLPDTCLHIYGDITASCDLHSIGTMLNPTALAFGYSHNRQLFQGNYRLDSLRLNYKYKLGRLHTENDAPDTLYIYLAHYDANDTNCIIINIDGQAYLCPKVLTGPIRPKTANCVTIRYPLQPKDTLRTTMSIPMNFGKATALGYEVPENRALSVMVRFVPGYSYRNGDTIATMSGSNVDHLRNAFSLQCHYSSQSAQIIAKGYNHALIEKNELRYQLFGNANDSCYTPSTQLLPDWDYHLSYNTRPLSAYRETDTAICGPMVWNGMEIKQSGDYRQIFVTDKGNDSMVVMHLQCDAPIGNMAPISGARRIDSIGDYEFSIPAVAGASNYHWELSSPQWQLENADSLRCLMKVGSRGQGLLTVHAYSAHKGCHESQSLRLIYCDSISSISEIQGRNSFSGRSLALFSVENMEKAQYRWHLSDNSGWEINGDSTLSWIIVDVSCSGMDTLFLEVTDECGYVTRRQAVIRCEVNVGNISHTLAAEVYPNPAHEQIQIILPDGTAQADYCLTDALGRVLSKGMFNENRSELSLQPYRSGIYFLKITDGLQRSNVFKIVKQ